MEKDHCVLRRLDVHVNLVLSFSKPVMMFFLKLIVQDDDLGKSSLIEKLIPTFD